MDFANDSIWGKPEKGFLPRSFALYLAAFYMALFIIRPWEVLFPSLGPLHFERICAIVVILGVALTSGFRFRLDIQNLAVVIFLAVIGISALRAYDSSSAWDSFYILLTLVACYFVLVSVIRTPYHLVMIVGAYILIMEVYLGKSLWEYFLHGRHTYTMNVTRLEGIETTFGSPNALAGSIVLSLPFWLFLWKRRNEITADCSKRWRQLVNLGLRSYVVLAVVSIALTNSRTGMVNFCIFLFLAGWGAGSIGKTTRNMVVAALIIVMVWLVLPEEQKDRVRTIWNPDINESATASAEGRTEGFKMGLQMFRRFPVFGVGPGCFISYRVPNLDGVNLVAHNLPGQLLGETGLFGTAGFVLLVAAVYINIRRVARLVHAAPNNTACILREVTRACRDVIILLMVEGISGDVLYRYNWLWLAAFCSLASAFAVAIPQNEAAATGDDAKDNGKSENARQIEVLAF